MTAQIHGHFEPRFERVAQAFAASFEGARETREHGAQLAIYENGRVALDLWGGWEDEEQQVELRRSGLICTYSAIKGPAALLMWILAERGMIDLHRPIADLWPEFGAHNKAAITPWHVLTHQAGIHLVADEAVDLGFEQAVWREALENAPARHAPQAERWYHGITYGFILAELALRATGKDFREVFWEEVAGPLAADVHVGVTPAMVARTVPVLPPLASPSKPGDPQGFGARAMRQLTSNPGLVNTSGVRTSINPASLGFATARGLARIYAALAGGGLLDGVRIAQETTVRAMTAEAWDGLVHGPECRWRMAAGVQLSTDYSWFGTSLGAFGHPGMGGGIAFADPVARLAFAYLPVRLGADSGGHGARSRVLVDALESVVRTGS